MQFRSWQRLGGYVVRYWRDRSYVSTEKAADEAQLLNASPEDTFSLYQSFPLGLCRVFCLTLCAYRGMLFKTIPGAFEARLHTWPKDRIGFDTHSGVWCRMPTEHSLFPRVFSGTPLLPLFTGNHALGRRFSYCHAPHTHTLHSIRESPSG